MSDSISVISKRREDDIERLSAMDPGLQMKPFPFLWCQQQASANQTINCLRHDFQNIMREQHFYKHGSGVTSLQIANRKITLKRAKVFHTAIS